MPPVLHKFQNDLKSEVYQGWNQGAKNVVMQLATGGGKTVTLSSIVLEHPGFTCVMAHRQELLSQLSTTLARYGIRHRIVGTDSLRREISRNHVAELGQSFVDQTARAIVASVDSLLRADVSEWAHLVTLWVTDEGHHVVLDNKWHRALQLFTNTSLIGLLPTATPIRADKKGLGRPEIGGSGVADLMVEGPPMRWLINNNFLSDYRMVCPTSDLEILGDVGASGDWSNQQLKEAAKRSHIVGDLVKGYLTFGLGLLGVTFCTDIETAMETARAYRAVGVRAECLTGKTDDTTRRHMLRRFAARELDQLVAVDIISEGFDLPLIECLSMGRPTMSYSLFAQQFGRALRVAEGKGKALIIDHVGNIMRHEGPPDKPRFFSLANRDKRSKSKDDTIPYRRCVECLTPYEASFGACPACGHKPPVATRDAPAAVDGVMEEMSPELLEALRTNVAQMDRTPGEVRSEHALAGWSQMMSNVHMRNHGNNQHAQHQLRAAMALWAGPYRAAGYDNDRLQRAFFHLFGLSVLEAQALTAKDATALMERIGRHRHAIV